MSDVPLPGIDMTAFADPPVSARVPWWVIPALGAMVFTIFWVALGLAFLWGNETQQTTMLTAAVTLSSGVLGYFFGSSSSNQRKDETIARMKGVPPDSPVAIAVSNPAP